MGGALLFGRRRSVGDAVDVGGLSMVLSESEGPRRVLRANVLGRDVTLFELVGAFNRSWLLVAVETEAPAHVVRADTTTTAPLSPALRQAIGDVPDVGELEWARPEDVRSMQPLLGLDAPSYVMVRHPSRRRVGELALVLVALAQSLEDAMADDVVAPLPP
jgi:hypothetical protein